jgi:hypothetical protein
LNWGGALEFYRDSLRTFEIITGMPLARRGRRVEVFAGQNFGEGVARGGAEVVYGHQELTAHLWVGSGGRGDGRRCGSHGGRGGGRGVLVGEEVPGEEEGQARA